MNRVRLKNGSVDLNQVRALRNDLFKMGMPEGWSRLRIYELLSYAAIPADSFAGRLTAGPDAGL